MRRGKDIAVEFPGLYLVHHNLPGKELDAHSHKQHLLFIPLQGEIAVATKKAKLTCSPGKMIYLPPNTEHSFQSSTQQGERLIALIDSKSWSKAGGKKSPSKSVSTNQLIKELFFHLLINQKTAAQYSSALLMSAVQVLNGCLEASSSDGSIELEHINAKVKDLRVRKAFDAIVENYANEIALPALAKTSGISVRNLNRLFLQETGMTPKKLLALQRITKAKELLSKHNTSVTSAALDVGYNSLSQFIHTFQRITGKLPSDFAKTH